MDPLFMIIHSAAGTIREVLGRQISFRHGCSEITGLWRYGTYAGLIGILCDGVFLVRSDHSVHLDAVHRRTETAFIFQETLRANSDSSTWQHQYRRPTALPYSQEPLSRRP
jgi:hypothetical protein